MRTARVQMQSRAVGDRIHHPAGARAALRNSIMSAKTTAQWHEAVACLYGEAGPGAPLSASVEGWNSASGGIGEAASPSVTA